MGYSKGTKWTKELIESSIREVIKGCDLNTMPTARQMDLYFGNSRLSNKISKTDGFNYWAEKLNLNIKKSTTSMGQKWEHKLEDLLTKIGYKCEQMPTNYPFDILVNGCVKIDVKSSHRVGKDKNYYTFNLEKKNPTCDIYVFYCLNYDETVRKAYVIPAVNLCGMTQFSTGIGYSKYDMYSDRWGYIKLFEDFYKGLKQ